MITTTKLFLLFSVVLCISVSCTKEMETPSTENEAFHFLSPFPDERISFSLALESGGFLMGGSSVSKGFVKKVSNNGKLEWYHKLGDKSRYYNASVDSEGNYVVAGANYSSNDNGLSEGLLNYFSQSGELLWSKTYQQDTTSKLTFTSVYHSSINSKIYVLSSWNRIDNLANDYLFIYNKEGVLQSQTLLGDIRISAVSILENKLYLLGENINLKTGVMTIDMTTDETKMVKLQNLPEDNGFRAFKINNSMLYWVYLTDKGGWHDNLARYNLLTHEFDTVRIPDGVDIRDLEVVENGILLVGQEYQDNGYYGGYLTYYDDSLKRIWEKTMSRIDLHVRFIDLMTTVDNAVVFGVYNENVRNMYFLLTVDFQGENTIKWNDEE